jgi:putative addiction module killer protein
MWQVKKTDVFDGWLSGLTDQRAVAKIASRIERLENGNPGDVRDVGGGVSELKIDCGPGYRVYYKRTGKDVMTVLCGGDKSTQDKDIRRAATLAAALKG